MRYVNLGCGSRYHPDWVNIDIVARGPEVIAHDISKGIPLNDANVDVVYHSHVLEHIRRDQAVSFLQECRRVLKPGGVMRVATPDLEKLCRLLLEKLDPATEGDAGAVADHEWLMLEMYDQTVRESSGGRMVDYLKRRPIPNKAFVLERIGEEGREILRHLNEAPHEEKSRPSVPARLRRWLVDLLLGRDASLALEIGRFRLSGEVHQWMYDRHSLAELLRQAGFQDAHRCEANESGIPEWGRFHLDTLEDGSPIKPDSFYMEAERPPS